MHLYRVGEELGVGRGGGGMDGFEGQGQVETPSRAERGTVALWPC